MNLAAFFESLSMKKQSNEMTEDWYPTDSLYSFLTSSQMSSFVPAEDGSAERGNVDFNTDFRGSTIESAGEILKITNSAHDGYSGEA